MSRALAVALLALAACGRNIDLGSEDMSSTNSTTVSAGCQSDSECGPGKSCISGACTYTQQGCGSQESCDTSSGTYCADACPTCTAGERCCTDNGFGECQCFCALSCGGPSCALEGTDPGPQGSSCGSDADCLCGETCSGGTCRSGPLVAHCASSADCASAGCSTDRCVNGRCVPPSWSCVNDRECGPAGSGYACSGGACQCTSHAGLACTDSSQCSACAGESCRAGVCSVFTTSGNIGSATGGATSSGGSTGGVTGTSGTGTTGGCACSADADCNDAFHEGYVCSGGFCAPGPTSATLSSTGGVCAGQGSTGGTAGSGTVGSGSSGSVGASGST